MKTTVMQELVYRVWSPVYFFRRGMQFERRLTLHFSQDLADDLAAKSSDLMRQRLGCETVHGQLDCAIGQANVLMDEVRELRTLLWMTEERMGIATAAKRWMEDLIGKMLEGPDGMELGRRYLKRLWVARNIEREEKAVSEVTKVAKDADGRILTAMEVKERMAALQEEMALIGGKGEAVGPWKALAAEWGKNF